MLKGTLKYKNTLTKDNAGDMQKQLIRNGYKIHHSATIAGYVSVHLCEVYEYNGRFGEGYAFVSSDYRVSKRWARIDYIVRE